ncbi:MAG TPA: zinc-dependent alcohol dehydrogenase family protein [Verrucomicrobiae bacterium]|nr:zinc-dependent alcohol dehydrogenase family protein [Verrucomicrobiae bacterium]
MQAMVLVKAGEQLILRELDVPRPGPQQVLIRVRACGVCRTDLHIVDGELPNPKLPLILGHEIVGEVVASGQNAARFRIGEVVGVPWLGWTCGMCRFCKMQRENLCDNARFTGYTIDGGYAEYTVAYEDFCFRMPEQYQDAHGAPLLCAGLIGYRSYRMTGDHVQRLGLYGFGAAAHILAQIAVYQGRDLYAFTKPGDTETQDFARRLGATWAGDSDVEPPEKLDAAIIFAPVGELVPAALRATTKGGIVVCGGIHMSDIPRFPYRILWEERVVRSVANLERCDGEEFFEVAPRSGVKTEVQIFPVSAANEALDRLRTGRISGAAVLQMQE